MKNHNQAFICGMSRGGTTWLGRCLNEHPEVAVFGETLFWGRCYVKETSTGVYEHEGIDSVIHFQRNLNTAFYGDSAGCLKKVGVSEWHKALGELKQAGPLSPKAVFDHLVRKVGLLENKSIVIEKTPHHLNHIAKIEKWYPDSRYIIMVRDPYSFMLSYKNQGLQRSVERRKRMARYFHPIGCALVWKGCARKAAIEIKRLGDRAILVHFQDLKADPDGVWERVVGFLGIKPTPLPRVDDKNSSFSKHERPKLSGVDVFWMNLIARDTITNLGYEKRNASVPLFSVIGSLFSLVPCSIRILREISLRSSGSFIGYVWNWIRVGRS